MFCQPRKDANTVATVFDNLRSGRPSFLCLLIGQSNWRVIPIDPPLRVREQRRRQQGEKLCKDKPMAQGA